jgi:hypothetical protein
MDPGVQGLIAKMVFPIWATPGSIVVMRTEAADHLSRAGTSGCEYDWAPCYASIREVVPGGAHKHSRP